MATTAQAAVEAGVRPLAPSLKAVTLPEVAVKLALGAQVQRDGDQVMVSFEGDLTQMHEEDFALASKVAGRVRAQLPKRLSPGGVIKASSLAHKGVSDELFRPGAVRVLYYSTMSKASAFYRCLMPMYALNMSGKAVAHASAARFGREALDYDIVVIQIDNSPSALEFVKALQGMGKKVVYEIDDAFDCLEPWHPQYASYGQPARQAAIQAMMRQADAVQVSTAWLVDRYRKIAKRVEVVPNMIELAAWPKADKLRRDGLWKVLWAGSPSHSGDLAEVVPALGRFARAHEDVRIVLFGQEIKDERIPQSRVEVIPWCEFEEYPFKLAAVDADVAIAPLADIPFNRGKSNLRLLQYWATGYPVIASSVGPYRNAIVQDMDGILCRTEDDWVNGLEETYRNAFTCRSLSEAGAEAVKAWDVIGLTGRVEAFYSSLIAR